MLPAMLSYYDQAVACGKRIPECCHWPLERKHVSTPWRLDMRVICTAYSTKYSLRQLTLLDVSGQLGRTTAVNWALDWFRQLSQRQ